jgi:hypothetical protein
MGGLEQSSLVDLGAKIASHERQPEFGANYSFYMERIGYSW